MPPTNHESPDFGNFAVTHHGKGNISQSQEAQTINREHHEERVEESTKEVIPTDAEANTNILEKSQFVVGDAAPLTSLEEIHWLDLSLVKEAMDWFKEYIGLYVATSIVSTLTLAVCVKPISTIIFCSNQPMERGIYFRRFLAKLRGIEKFFTQMLNPVEMQKEFYKVRKLHTFAVARYDKIANGKPLPEILVWKEEAWMRDLADAVRKDVATIPRRPKVESSESSLNLEEALTWNNKLPFSQLAIICVTAAFFGSVWKNPQLFGIRDKHDRKMKALVHMWAVICSLLGLRDEFNIYIIADPEQIDRLCDEVFVESLSKIDTVVIFLQKLVADGIRVHYPLISQKEVLYLVLQSLGSKGNEHLWKVMDLKDKIYVKFAEGLFWLAGNVTWFRYLTNLLVKEFLNSLYRTVLCKSV